MTANVGIVEGEEAVMAGQGHDKHVSAEADTDATIKDAVLSMRAFVERKLLTRFPSNDSQQYTKRCAAWYAAVLYGEVERGSKQ
jgi:hypothetical protein